MSPPAIRHLPAITGFGCVSPLGCGLPSTRQALREGADGISDVRLFSVSSFRAKTAGQVVGCAFENPQGTRAENLLLPAVREALAFRPGFLPEIVIAGTTSGGMDFGENFLRGHFAEMSPRDARRWVRGYGLERPVLDVICRLGIQAPVRVVSNACASGTNALCLAAGLVRGGVVRRVMAIGFDALSELIFAGFDSLRASTEEKCRPFDSARSGLALGEGAACFLVEEFSEVPAAGVLATIPGWGLANDNYHLTQPNPDGSGPRLSMQRALADAGWSTVDYINAHGTGTAFNDASEAAAIRAVCPSVPVSSTKGMTGHALGAAGAIEAAFCLLAIEGGFLPPNINLRETDSGLDIVANAARPARIRRAMSNSFGFGGANATVLLEVPR
ncbi:MAG: beta-ketoacyl-[acyl-carrier-protein] synthase family protein [Verrucomicrobiae bacterium]